MLLPDINILVYAHRADAPDHAHFREWLEDLINSDRGNLVPDAYLAALAIESGSEWITTERGFARYPGLRWRHPLA
jgi:predicted nucleic acid-binding protein